MKIALRKVEFQNPLSNVENLGTLGQSLEIGDKLRFGVANFGRTDKALVIFVTEKGSSDEKLLNVGKELSAQIRTIVARRKMSANQVLKAMLSLPLVKNEKGTFVGRKGQRLEGLEITQEIVDAPVDWEEMVAF